MNQAFVSFLMVDSSVKVFVFLGSQFQILAPFTENKKQKTFRGKEVLKNGTL